jgi:diguanylate cyclase (GGDEF)-like protein
VVDDSAKVARLLESAQTGGHDEALRCAEETLRAPTGDLADGPAGMHFVRCVALICAGRTDEVMAAANLMLDCTESRANHGWRSCALSIRAWQRLMLTEQHAEEHDVDAVLRDLVDAEVALAQGVEDAVVAENAHTALGLGFSQLRLYELALPHYEAAYAVSAQDGRGDGAQAMWQSNIAILHLNWALELYRVRQPAEAEQHSRMAGQHAAVAAEQASGPDAERWRNYAWLLGGCAAADGPDPAGAAQSIERHAAALNEFDMRLEVSFSQPFLAVALSRSGDDERALQVIERAVRELPADAGWLATATAQHTMAILLARDGERAAEAALVYGDTLTQALWRQRLRTLHTATAMKSYDRLQAEHEQVARTADTDPLTGIANRRGFDRAVAEMDALDASGCVGVLLVDLDGFKQVNDSEGHAAGDRVLQGVASELKAVVRDADVVARLGGDEFGVLLPGARADEAAQVAQRMVRGVDGMVDCAVTVSIGYASGATSEIYATLRAADAAMYVAKRAGGNRHRGHRDRGGGSHSPRRAPAALPRPRST